MNVDVHTDCCVNRSLASMSRRSKDVSRRHRTGWQKKGAGARGIDHECREFERYVWCSLEHSSYRPLWEATACSSPRRLRTESERRGPATSSPAALYYYCEVGEALRQWGLHRPCWGCPDLLLARAMCIFSGLAQTLEQLRCTKSRVCDYTT